MNTQLTELMRLITNLIRTGTISAVDKESWLCRVKTGDLETNLINWLTLRAGSSRTWWKPSVGEQVLLLSLGDHLDTAFALPAIYSDACPPPSASEEGSIILFPDGARFEYEPENGQLAISGVKSIRIDTADNIELNTEKLSITASQMHIRSDVVINGSVKQSGGEMSANGVVVDSHKHGGVKAGSDTSGGPQ
ncbi:phage baseplate assembly protein V [Erwinia sp. 198]|uniref:phage baseplate assembly protein V n=1 Tax=Erwinia sp. 198 TaxID=2022746 RepID=UPI000F669167|nr:phage baseplate assembly protein V [Erwinia sp. 198]RRZ88538.1 phage baseplate assembly protein V [Erwinia sp. 198]